MKLPWSLGTLILAIWLILYGLAEFLNLGDLGVLVPVLAIVAGILLLLSR